VRYEKAETVLKIALEMQATAEGLSLEDIQHRFAVSRRTAERLRDAIERVFPSMEQANPGELPKRWRFPAGTVSGLAAVSAEELAGLAAGVSLLRRENMQVHADNAESAVSKLRALMKPNTLTKVDPDLEALTEAEGIAMRPGPRPRIGAAIVADLRQAILAGRKVKLHYKYRGSGKTGYDTVHPYGFIYGNRHYLIAWSENRQARDFRNFALANVDRVEFLDSSFKRQRDFSLKDYAERSFGVFQEKPFEVELKFSPKVAPDAKEFLFHPSQTMTEKNDGSLIVRFRAGGIREMTWHIATWGNEVRVLKPTRLKHSLVELSKAISLAGRTTIRLPRSKRPA
jgi:predicted DNA-binding transcriptional regulator YafY